MDLSKQLPADSERKIYKNEILETNYSQLKINEQLVFVQRTNGAIVAIIASV